MSNNIEVKSCPFCGGTDISNGEFSTLWPDGRTSVQSSCMGCGAAGPEAFLELGEIDLGDVQSTAAWNTRAALAAPQQEPMRELLERWIIFGRTDKMARWLVAETEALLSGAQHPSEPAITQLTAAPVLSDEDLASVQRAIEYFDVRPQWAICQELSEKLRALLAKVRP